MGSDPTLAMTPATVLDGARAAEARLLERGETVGRFVVMERLGEGGMGVVSAAYDPELDRKVAIKLLRPHPGALELTGEQRARALREAQAMARLSHANVITVHDVGTVGGSVFIAMELIEGGTLRARLAALRGKTAAERWRDVLALLVPAGRGLAAAHAAGLVHRDFKPDNVLCGRDGRIRVTDFGLVAPAEGHAAVAGPRTPAGSAAGGLSGTRTPRSSDLTRDGTVLGTPRYMAPEQHRGEVADGRADQFAFCVALYEAIHRRHPFGDDDAAIRAAVVGGRLREPGRAGVPAWLGAAIARGLAHDPEARFASMDELLGELTRDRGRVARRAAAVAAVVVAGAALMVAANSGGGGAARSAVAGAPAAEANLPEALVMHLSTTHLQLGTALRARGDFDGAIARARAAVALRLSMGARHPRVADARNNLGIALRDAGRFGEALAEHDQALAARVAAHGERHGDVAASLNNRAMTLHDLGRVDEAIAAYQRALAIQVAVNGEHHVLTAAAHNNLGMALGTVGRHAEAVPHLRAALAGRRAALPAGHRDIAMTRGNLGKSLVGAGDVDAGLDELRAAVAMFETTLGGAHPTVSYWYGELGSALARVGRTEQALAACAGAHRVAVAGSADATGLDAAYARLCTGRALVAAGRGGAAVAPLERALAALTASEEDEYDLADARFLLARALGRRDLPRALDLARAARDGFAASDGARAEIAAVDAWLARHR